MSWRDDLRPASFRSVPFYVDSASGQGGRRIVVHEYPNQDDHDTEDMGKKSGEYRLSCFLVGDNYHTQRDTLFAALDQPTAATLVHPYLGTMSVRIVDYSWSITTRRGGYCQIDISYVLEGRKPIVLSASNTAALIDAANDVSDKTQTAFVDKFNCVGEPEFVRDSATDILGDAVSAIRKVNDKINAQIAAVQDVASDIDALGNEISTLILAPANLISTLASVVSSVMGAYSDIKTAFGAYDDLLAGFRIGSSISRTAANGVATDTRAVMANNQEALATALVSVATVAIAQQIANSQTPFTTYDSAIDVRDALLAGLETQAAYESLTWDEYNAIVTLQTALYKRIDDVAPGLQRIDYIQRGSSLPALVIAHQVYSDATLADELITRNKIANPLFMPAGKDIEVLI